MPKKSGHFEIYRSKKEFRWRFIKNGRIIFASTESYKRRSGAHNSLFIAKLSTIAEVIDFTKKK